MMQTSLSNARGVTWSSKRSKRLQVQNMAGKNPPQPKDTAKPKEKNRSIFEKLSDASGFAQTRSREDEKLLTDAKRGKGREDDGRMSRDQYKALRRKVGGTYRDYMKDFIEADEVDSVKSTGIANTRKGIPILITVVGAVFAATLFVLSATKGDPTYNPSQPPTENQTQYRPDKGAKTLGDE